MTDFVPQTLYLGFAPETHYGTSVPQTHGYSLPQMKIPSAATDWNYCYNVIII